MANLDPNQMMFRADRGTEKLIVTTINGNPVKHVATQNSRRTRRKRTVYVYHIVGTDIIVFNRSLDGIYFLKIAIMPQNVKRFYDTFVNPPQTAEEKIWLERYDYVLV